MTDVAAIYFPSWHEDPRRDREFGRGWTEWELVRAGRPRFPGHYQPIVPAWGHADETHPSNMQRSCDAAKRAGVDAFLWDWYWYDDADGDYLNRPLDETFMGLPEPGVEFALMWANHDWIDVFPARAESQSRLMYPGAVSPEAFRRMIHLVADRYLGSDRYWRPNGAAWFTIYRVDVLIEGLGGEAATAELLLEFRHLVRERGLGELHLNALDGWQDFTAESLIALGIDSVGHYNWASVLDKSGDLEVDYAGWRDRAEQQWQEDHAKYVEGTGGKLRYIPNVTMGWDSTARVAQDDDLVVSEWPFLPVVTGNTPDEFSKSLQAATEFGQRTNEPILFVNAWNEWTEGSYLEPDDRYGEGYLDALRDMSRTR